MTDEVLPATVGAMKSELSFNELLHRETTLDSIAGADLRPSTDEAGRRVYWALAYDSTSTDLHGTRMTADAFRGSAEGLEFPILTFHNKSSFPVGKPVAVEYDSKGLHVGFVFASTPEAKTAEELVSGGFLRGVSVGFIPRDGFVDKADGAPVFTRADLIELSLTPTPSSRKALVDLTRSIGADAEELVEAFGLQLHEVDTEDRPKSLVPPTYMQESAERGIELYEAGEGGEGLREQTIEEAKDMAAGRELEPDKWERISAWIARHIGDLEGVEPGEITPGVVAMLLWGGGSTTESAQRAKDYADRVVAALPEWHPDYQDERAAAIETLRALGVDESILSLLMPSEERTEDHKEEVVTEVVAEAVAEEELEAPEMEDTSKQPATIMSDRERALRNLSRTRRHS